MHLFDIPPLGPDGPGGKPTGHGSDPELTQVAEYLRELDPDGRRIAEALRRTFDMLLDGQHTGRYRWDELYKTEKTHFGTLVEINLQREFDFAGGDDLDYLICGIEVDCKYSQKLGAWMLPLEAVGRLCLGLWASDTESRWSAGLFRATEGLLNKGGNRDSKRTLSEKGRQSVQWLFSEAQLPENALLHMPARDVAAVFAHRHGTTRVDELFRRAQGRLVRRAVVATVAQQEDYMKRVRGNGGARSNLRPEGIIILGHFSAHREIAAQLGLPEPGPGEFVSARVVRTVGQRGGTPIDGTHWKLASSNDPVEPAPRLPKV
ncbi:restriction endonuclease NaeI [Murinocardiopsis flavida]|uniref:Restriction endonuclease NaeI n=1 Tax=Murinocardiopsis flavida TaxID=645275 RepID=A0A2P8CWM5_9ACTN|nr:NaeI family type II restriction endonuclease [Murinocardiopsis flavida]PSK89371.1 restriction endonuclease NaeI [Murinocardiopsis flavida]